jgi:hypothetical protein
MQEIPASVQSSTNRELQGSGASNRKHPKKSALIGSVVHSRCKASEDVSKPLTQNDTKSRVEGEYLLPAAI